MTTQNLKVALHVPLDTPGAGQVVRVKTSTPYTTEYAAGGGGGAALPAATKEGQVLTSGTGPAFAWSAEDLDQGAY